MRPGDVVAFGGRSFISKLTKWLTHSDVSHVGVILQTGLRDNRPEDFDNLIIESTGKGVKTRLCSKVVNDYDGEVWWLPLNHELRRNRFDQRAFKDFLYRAKGANRGEGASFDPLQALLAMIDQFDDGTGGLTYSEEDLEEYYCAELVAAGLEHAGALPNINASEVSPIDLCRWALFETDYIQLRGDSNKRIRGHNTISPRAWQLEPE
jgi:hypothetical protein